jgi:hypothetical protein
LKVYKVSLYSELDADTKLLKIPVNDFNVHYYEALTNITKELRITLSPAILRFVNQNIESVVFSGLDTIDLKAVLLRTLNRSNSLDRAITSSMSSGALGSMVNENIGLSVLSVNLTNTDMLTGSNIFHEFELNETLRERITDHVETSKTQRELIAKTWITLAESNSNTGEPLLKWWKEESSDIDEIIETLNSGAAGIAAAKQMVKNNENLATIFTDIYKLSRKESLRDDVLEIMGAIEEPTITLEELGE